MGYRRITENWPLGVKVAASIIWQILKTNGIDPAPDGPGHPGAVPESPPWDGPLLVGWSAAEPVVEGDRCLTL